MPTKPKAQIGFEDTILPDAELENLLEARQALKGHVSEYREADKAAKDKIRTITAPMPFRVGRFLISERPIPAKEVSFETTESTTLSIKTVDED